MKRLESQLQRACVKWFRYQYPHTLMFAIPNGGARDVVTGAILKAEGVLPGIPDLFIAHAAGGCNGLFIEMKSPAGTLAIKQKEIQARLIDAGYCYCVCRSLESFQAIVNRYVQNSTFNSK